MDIIRRVWNESSLPAVTIMPNMSELAHGRRVRGGRMHINTPRLRRLDTAHETRRKYLLRGVVGHVCSAAFPRAAARSAVVRRIWLSRSTCVAMKTRSANGPSSRRRHLRRRVIVTFLLLFQMTRSSACHPLLLEIVSHSYLPCCIQRSRRSPRAPLQGTHRQDEQVRRTANFLSRGARRSVGSGAFWRRKAMQGCVVGALRPTSRRRGRRRSGLELRTLKSVKLGKTFAKTSAVHEGVHVCTSAARLAWLRHSS